MKRNLSSQAIKAMAIGMAVAVGSSTAIGGVNVYASETVEAETLVPAEEALISEKANPAQAPAMNDTITVDANGVTYTFKVTVADSDGSNQEVNNGAVTLVSINSEVVQADNQNFTGSIDTTTVSSKTTIKVTTNESGEKNYYFVITQIGDGNSIAEGKTIVSTAINAVITNDVTKIGDNAFNNVTVDGDLTFGVANLSSSGSIGKKAFQNAHIKGNLDFSNLSPQKIDLSNQPFKGDEGNKGVTVDGILYVYKDESSGVKTHEFKNNEFEKVSVKELKIASISTENYTFKNATIGDETTKTTELLRAGRDSVNEGHLYGATVNGIVNLRPINTGDFTVKTKAFENANIYQLNIDAKTSAAFISEEGAFTNATIENLEILNKQVTFKQDGFFTGATIKNLGESITNDDTIPNALFKGAIIPSNVTINATTIGANAFDVANTQKVTISLPNYTSEINIDANAFGTNANVELILPFGTSQQDIDALESKLNNKNVSIVSRVEATNENGTYVFEQLYTSNDSNQVALIGYTAPSTATKNDSATFANGVLTHNNVKYNLTKIGNGTSLSNITDSALNGNTNYVKEISANAFASNKNITKANFPKVEKVGANAFANTDITSATLGTNVSGKISIDSSAFSGVDTLKTVNTNKDSKDVVKTALENSSSKDISLDAGGDKETVKPDNNGGSSGGSSGGGAVIGTNNDATTETTTSGNTSSVVEDKELSFDVISLPSVEGEAKVFGDVSANHWAKPYIDKLSTAGIINGSNGMFNPNGQTKRADVTIMLVNLLGLTPEANNKFVDVNPNAYYAPYVGTASTYGIVNGSNGMFNPENVISRQDTMVMIAQILKGLDLNVNTDATALNQFSDVNNVSSYATESVAILVNSGIISGNNGKLNPTAPVTRAEMATIMSKLYDVLAQAK